MEKETLNCVEIRGRLKTPFFDGEIKRTRCVKNARSQDSQRRLQIFPQYE